MGGAQTRGSDRVEGGMGKDEMKRKRRKNKRGAEMRRKDEKEGE